MLSKFFFRSLFIFLGIFLISFFITPLALAQSNWSNPTNISSPTTNNALTPTITSGPNGYLYAVWMELAGEEWGGTTPGIFYSFWNGDSWSLPEKISKDYGTAEFPNIIVTSNGNIHVVWDEDTAGNYRFQVYHSYFNGDVWSTPESLSAVLGTTDTVAWGASLKADQSDNFYLTYSTSINDQPQVYYQKYNGSSWSVPEPISGDLSISLSDLTIDSNGKAHVFIAATRNDTQNQQSGIYYATNKTADDSWVLSSNIDPADGKKFPRIVTDTNDNLYGVWTTYNDVTNITTIKYASKIGLSDWSINEPLSENLTTPYWGVINAALSISIDENNNLYAVWGEKNDSLVNLSYRMKDGLTNEWSSIELVQSTATANVDSPYLISDQWSNQHLTWSDLNETSGQWELKYSSLPANIVSYNPSQPATTTLVGTNNDTLSIPAEALPSETTISVQIGPLPASADPNYTTLPRSFILEPSGTEFPEGKEVTLVIHYTDEEVMGADESNLKLYIWDSQTNSWGVSFPTIIDPVANTATVTLNHFSIFSLRAPKAQTQVSFLPPLTIEDTYTMQDGSTLPFKFQLSLDGTILTSLKNVEVIITGSGFESEVLIPFFDPETGKYQVNLHTKELGMEIGNYQGTVNSQTENLSQNNISFSIIEQGKAKGQTK